MPADANALSGRPPGDARSYRINYAYDLVPGDAWVLHQRKGSLPGEGVTVADAAGLDLDPHRSGAGFGDFAFHDFERCVRAEDLQGAHLGHNASNYHLGMVDHCLPKGQGIYFQLSGKSRVPERGYQ